MSTTLGVGTKNGGRYALAYDPLAYDPLAYDPLAYDPLAYDSLAYSRSFVLQPRALWMGLEFVKWVLGRAWFGRAVWSEQTDGKAWVRGNNVHMAWEEIWRRLDPQTLKKLKYYRRYLREDAQPDIQLYGVYASTTHDDDPEYYVEVARWFDMALGGGEDGDAGDAGDVGDVGDVGRGRRETSGAFREALELGEPFDGRYAGDVLHPVEKVLGYRLFLGGIDSVAHEAYMKRFLREI